MPKLIAVALLILISHAAPSLAQTEHADFAFYPGQPGYDESIPTLQQVVGHVWGDKITSPDEAGLYIQTLAQASPRVQVHRYGETWEGRPLWYVTVTSEDNLSRIDSIRAANLELTTPRATDSARAEAIVADNPVLVWLAYGVHGNEISSTDAALLTMYHLAAARSDEVADRILANTVVLIDPMQNPDGRNRFVNHYRQSVGRWPSSQLASVEQNEPWPGGRTNHYLFDLNRDWFAQTQPETRGKVAAYREWMPQIYIDLHEMGGNSTYYFPPQADPINPNETEDIARWIGVLGENNARWFDRMGFDYFTREVFDAFYPGYGVSWPFYQGAIGATYEEASSRGLARDRSDETILHYRDTVQHHFIASISTAEMAAMNRQEILRDFYAFGVEAIESGSNDSIREVILTPGTDPGRAAKLVRVLMSQGIEVARATEPFGNVVQDYYGGATARVEFPAGTYRVSMAQPAKHAAKVLLAPETPMDEEFIAEQQRRFARRLGDQIYDISGWSLPLLFGIEAYTASEPSTDAAVLAGDLLSEPPSSSGGVTGEAPATVAYLVPWGTQAAAEGLAALHHHDIRVHSAGASFTLGGRTYPPGSLIIKVHDNADDLHQQLQMIGQHHGVEFVPTDTSWVTDGINFGSGRVRYLPKPRIAIAWDRPTSSNSAGWARYLLESAYHTPVTIIRTEQLGRADLDDYNVLILPDAFSFGGGGGYETSLGERDATRIRDWVQAGGTLVALGNATQWLIAEDVGLLATATRMKTNDIETEETRAEQTDAGLPAGVYPEQERPAALPGAILRAQVDPDHWLGFGYDDRINLIAQSRNIYDPIKIDDGLNIATYVANSDELLVSGVAWRDQLETIAGTPFLMYQPHGGGHIIAFAEDPNFRAYFDGLNLLFLNGVMLGPGY